VFASQQDIRNPSCRAITCPLRLPHHQQWRSFHWSCGSSRGKNFFGASNPATTIFSAATKASRAPLRASDALRVDISAIARMPHAEKSRCIE